MAISVDQYIQKLQSPQKEICERLRQFILETIPNIHEEMKNGVPWYEGKFYIVGLKSHVNLGFAINGLTQEEQALFEGSGKLMRHRKIRTIEEIDAKEIEMLLKLVYVKAVCED